MLQVLNDKNFLIYCASVYDNPNCRDTKEFLEDLQRIKYIKKLITRYVESGNLKERLILNHLIVLSNVFPAEALARILYLKMEAQMPYLKPFLVMMGLLPRFIYNIGEINRIDTDLILLDKGIVERLRKI